MALNSAKAQAKWHSIQQSTSAPLQRVLDGSHTKGDVNVLGMALKSYDELAYSVFAEGIRLAELQARTRVDSVQQKRVAKNKGLTARQLSIIYAQAVDQAHERTMPQLLSDIKSILESQGKDLDAAHIEDSVNKPLGEQKPLNLHRRSLQNFKVEKAANDDTKDTLRDTLLAAMANQATRLEKRLLRQLRRLFNPRRNESESEVTHTESVSAPVTPSATEPAIAPLPTTEAIAPKQEASPNGAESELMATLLARDAALNKKLDSLLKKDNPKEPKEEPLLPKDSQMGKVFEYVRSKYSKLRRGVSKAGSFLGPLVMAGMALANIPTLIKAVIDNFKDVDVMKLVQDTFSSAADWILRKVYALLGINKDPANTGPTTSADSETIGGVSGPGARDHLPVAERGHEWATPDASKPDGVASKYDRAQALKYVLENNFTPEEAEAFNTAHKHLGVTVPEDRIGGSYQPEKERAPAVAKASPASVASDAKATTEPSASPSSQPAAPNGAMGAGKGMTVSSSPQGSSKPAPNAQPAGASPSAPAPTTVPKGTSGLSASMSMPLSTPSKGSTAVAPDAPQSRSGLATPAAPQASKPVVATPPPPAPPPAAQQAPLSAGKSGGGSQPPVNSGSCPTHSARNECSLFLNATGTGGAIR